jgi:FkbM family methyltransferase
VLALQKLVMLTLRPYIYRELPGWGKLHALALDFRKERFWRGAPIVEMRGKDHGYVTTLDLSYWQDRTTYFLGRWHDARLVSLAKAYIEPTGTVVDVGANKGSFSLVASRLAKKVIAFEPNPRMADLIRRDIARNQISNIHVQQCGLGDANATSILSVPAHNAGEASFSQLSSSGEKVSANIRRGDEMLASETPSFIKVDVEGFETRAIAGLQHTIRRCRPIITTEIVRIHLERCGSSPEELTSLLVSLGYDGHTLGLKRSASGPSFTLEALNLSSNCDAVWFPR